MKFKRRPSPALFLVAVCLLSEYQDSVDAAPAATAAVKISNSLPASKAPDSAGELQVPDSPTALKVPDNRPGLLAPAPAVASALPIAAGQAPLRPITSAAPAAATTTGLAPLQPIASVAPPTLLASSAVRLPRPMPPDPGANCDIADCGNSAAKPVAKPSSMPVHIGPPAQRALVESHQWAENPSAMPLRDAGGRVMFPFSQSVPTIVCAPLHVCDIELQAGEVVQGAPHVGDSVRWKISPAISGSDEVRVTHLIVKPTEAGLDTNLIVPTDRHMYHIRLVSSTTRYVSSVGFYYSDEPQQAWSELAKNMKVADHSGRTTGGTGDMPTVAVDRLNFNYKIKVAKGRPLFKPVRAMDDGYHTYITMNEDLPQLEAPALVGISQSGAEQIVNYRLKGNIYIIDGTLPKMAFIAGVGREQQRVELTRDPCRHRGWLGICWDAKDKS